MILMEFKFWWKLAFISSFSNIAWFYIFNWSVMWFWWLWLWWPNAFRDIQHYSIWNLRPLSWGNWSCSAVSLTWSYTLLIHRVLEKGQNLMGCTEGKRPRCQYEHTHTSTSAPQVWNIRRKERQENSYGNKKEKENYLKISDHYAYCMWSTK